MDCCVFEASMGYKVRPCLKHPHTSSAGMVIHASDPNPEDMETEGYQEVKDSVQRTKPNQTSGTHISEAGHFYSSRPAWFTWQAPDQPELHNETLLKTSNK